MFQLLPVFLGLFDSTVQKLMNGFRDIFYELAYSNLSNMLSDLNEKVATISTELSTAPDAWQGGTIWELIVKIAEQVALPVAGTVFTFVVLWELISMLVQPNNLADIDFVSVLMKWLIKTIVAAWFISNALTICNCFFGKESLYMGLNSLSNGMIMADRKLLKNPNGLILGTPGSGKSFATKREILNTFLVTTDDILICDPEAEYYPLVNYLGGQVIKIGQSSKHYINPLDINLNYSDDDDPVSLKADFILSFMELVVGGKTGLKPEEKSAIDFAVSRIYTKYFENPVPENMPILQDLYNELLSHKEDLVSQHIAWDRCGI